MKSTLLLFILLSGFVLQSCMVDKEMDHSILFAEVAEVKLSTPQPLFFTADSAAMLELNVEYYDAQGKPIAYAKDLPYDLFVENKETSVPAISLDRKKNYSVHVQLNSTLKSNTVQVEVLPLSEAIQSIQFSLKNSGDFLQFEDTLPISHHFDIQVTDKRLGGSHQIPFSSEEVELFINDEKAGKTALLPSELTSGEKQLSIRIGALESNRVAAKIYHPRELIKTIELDFEDESRNSFIIAGRSTLSFNHQFLDQQERPLLIRNYALKVGGKTYSRMKDIPFEEAGELEVYVEAYGKRSNPLAISARQDKVYQEKQIPVIFHIVHNGDAPGSRENVGAQTIQEAIEDVNAAFDNSFGANRAKSLSAVNTHLKVIPASSNPQGQPLSEAGINRIQVSQDYFNGSETGAFMFDHMWNPNEYLNIFVLKINPNSNDANTSWAYYPTLSQPLEGVPSSTYEPALNYPYGVMFNSKHFNTTVLAHEIGHSLALPHTWVAPEDGNCYNSDYSKDTQDYIHSPSKVNGRYRLDCQNKKFRSTNYMDYNDGNYNSFTYDQRERMQFVYQHAYFFPSSSSQTNGRRKPLKYWKGEFDPSITPTRCSY